MVHCKGIGSDGARLSCTRTQQPPAGLGSLDSRFSVFQLRFLCSDVQGRALERQISSATGFVHTAHAARGRLCACARSWVNSQSSYSYENYRKPSVLRNCEVRAEACAAEALCGLLSCCPTLQMFLSLQALIEATDSEKETICAHRFGVA